jgi:hypothetical protein
MKVKSEEATSIQKVKDKSLFIDTIVEKISSVIKKQPKLFLNSKLKKLDKIETNLVKRDKRLTSILAESEEVKNKIKNEIDNLNKHNIKNRLKLTKYLGKVKSKDENK